MHTSVQIPFQGYLKILVEKISNPLLYRKTLINRPWAINSLASLLLATAPGLFFNKPHGFLEFLIKGFM